MADVDGKQPQPLEYGRPGAGQIRWVSVVIFSAGALVFGALGVLWLVLGVDGFLWPDGGQTRNGQTPVYFVVGLTCTILSGYLIHRLVRGVRRG